MRKGRSSDLVHLSCLLLWMTSLGWSDSSRSPARRQQSLFRSTGGGLSSLLMLPRDPSAAPVTALGKAHQGKASSHCPCPVPNRVRATR